MGKWAMCKECGRRRELALALVYEPSTVALLMCGHKVDRAAADAEPQRQPPKKFNGGSTEAA